MLLCSFERFKCCIALTITRNHFVSRSSVTFFTTASPTGIVMKTVLVSLSMFKYKALEKPSSTHFTLKLKPITSSLTNIMQPRLYMQSVQFASYRQHTDSITFETRLASGRREHFILTKNQFLALDDALILIRESNSYGHYPLGQNVWMHYNAFDASLYKETANGARINFIFVCFEEYKRHTHNRLRSLILLNCDGARRNRRRCGEAQNARCQRPLSVTMRSSHQPSSSKRSYRTEWKTASRSTDNVKLSHDDKTRSVLSKWDRTSPRRRSDSISSQSSTYSNLSSATSVRLELSDGELESE